MCKNFYSGYKWNLTFKQKKKVKGTQQAVLCTQVSVYCTQKTDLPILLFTTYIPHLAYFSSFIYCPTFPISFSPPFILSSQFSFLARAPLLYKPVLCALSIRSMCVKFSRNEGQIWKHLETFAGNFLLVPILMLMKMNKYQIS